MAIFKSLKQDFAVRVTNKSMV